MICLVEITSEKSKWKKDFPCTHRHRSAVALEEAASSGWSIIHLNWASGQGRKGRKRIKTRGDKTAIYMDVCMFSLRGFIKHHPAKSFSLILWIFHAAFPLNSGSWGSFDLFLKWLYACASLLNASDNMMNFTASSSALKPAESSKGSARATLPCT